MPALRARSSTERTLRMSNSLSPCEVRKPAAFQSRAIWCSEAPLSTRCAPVRIASASSSRSRIPSDSYPNDRRPPRNFPSSAACFFALLARSIMCSISCRAAAPNIRAIILPPEVDRSAVPACTVRTSIFLRSHKSMNPSSSIGRRCKRSVCHAITACALPASSAANIASYAGRVLPENAEISLSENVSTTVHPRLSASRRQSSY